MFNNVEITFEFSHYSFFNNAYLNTFSQYCFWYGSWVWHVDITWPKILIQT